MEWTAAAVPAAIGVLLQLGALIWYGGRATARLEDLAQRVDRIEARLDMLFRPPRRESASEAL